MTPGDVLGWEPFRELLARFAGTTLGRDRAFVLLPSQTLAVIESGLRETREARRALATEGPPPWDGVTDVRPTLAQAVPDGAILDGPALVALGRTLAAAGRLSGYGRRIAAVAPTVAECCRRLPTCAELATAITHDLDGDGRLLDRASPRLRTIRRQIQSLRGELQTRLEALLESSALAPALQERYVTLRNGRYVLPVRGDARRAVRGIVHDRSSSGATLFVEPDEVIDLNNQLTQRSLEERDEERRLLRELTRRVQAGLPDLETLVEGLGALDLAFARAALAERLDATEPEVREDGDLDLRGARHPLLVVQSWERGTPVVPIDLHVPADRPGLLITGPNAGGKTVALETAGLLVLMAHAGCHIPAGSPSRVPLCDQVLAVIGDEQSLAQNLSTFSSFVHQMREILARATARSLVLLDELGAGTDPAEGAALGAALVERLLDRGARVIATTHLEPLKVFAELEPRLENATVAFDAERLEPTFHLEYGRPGPSYALTIGERLGLPAAVIARARVHLSEEGRRVETLLADLAAREREAEARLAEAARREAEALQALERAQGALARAESEAARLRREAQAGARALLTETRRRVGQELDRLKAGEATRRRAQETYQRLRAAEAALAPTPAAATADDDARSGPMASEVQLRGLGLRGRVVAEDEAMVTVQAGNLTVRVPRSELEAAPGGEGRPRARTAAVSLPSRHDVPQEIRLLGQTTDEARAAVEKFLDDAVLAGHSTVRVVHGKGTGALKRAVEACLRAHPLVNRFRSGSPAEGGSGATVVELVPGKAER
ncbi:MAG: endonuclease MutS2 [Candidatus Rokubacteria bacterium]|nr:endonuclease MutS2 [Candidatus Rokubacteria bacterium]